MCVSLVVVSNPRCCAPPQTPQNALDVYGLRTNLVLAELAAAEDQFFAAGVGAAGNAALGRDARLADRVTAAVAAAFAAAHRMVDRVHRLGTRVRAVAHVPLPAGLADADVDEVEVGELADRRAAGAADAPHFTGWQDDDGVLAFLRAQSGDRARGANELPALPGVQFDVVKFRSEEHTSELQSP